MRFKKSILKAREEYMEELFFPIMENRLDMSESIHALPKNIQLSGFDLRKYPTESERIFAKTIAKQKKLTPEQVIGIPSSDSFITILPTYLRRGDHMLGFKHSFFRYRQACEFQGVDYVGVDDVDCNLNNILKHVTQKTGAIFLTTPTAPTAKFISYAEMKAFIEQVPKDILIVIDMAYIEFVDHKLNDYVVFDEFENVVFLQTMSKYYGLAGLRSGYIYGHKHVMSYLKAVDTIFSLNLVSASISTEAFKTDYSKVYIHNKKYREYAEDKFKEIGIDYFPSQTNFAMIKMSDKKSAAIIYELKEQHIYLAKIPNLGIRFTYPHTSITDKIIEVIAKHK